KISVTRNAVKLSTDFAAALDKILNATSQVESLTSRNPGEVFRQFSACMLQKMEGSIARDKSKLLPLPHYQHADEFITDLKTLYDGLTDSGCGNIARAMVLPLLRAAEAYRFRTVRLDVRENTTVSTHTLHAIWREKTGKENPPERNSDEWKEW